MARLWRWVCAVVGPLAMFALVWWVWFVFNVPPAGADRLGVALAIAGAVAVAGGAPLVAWAARESAGPEPVPVVAAAVVPDGSRPPGGPTAAGGGAPHTLPPTAASGSGQPLDGGVARGGDEIRVEGPFHGPTVIKGTQNNYREGGAR